MRMQTSKFPDRPWSRPAVGMFTLQRKEYIFLVDYYSNFVEVQELSEITSPIITKFLKQTWNPLGPCLWQWCATDKSGVQTIC